MSAIVERAVGGCPQPSAQPAEQQNRNEISPQGNDAKVNHSKRYVKHMHSGQAEEGRRKLRNAFGYVCKLASCRVSWHRRKNGQSQTRRNQVAPLPSVKD